MSVRVWTRVWAHSQHSGTELLMLLAIADFADEHGNAHPAVATLAQKCRMSDRNANGLLAKLSSSGELEIRRNEGPRGTNRYRILLSDAKGMKPASPPSGTQPLKPASPPTPEAQFTPPEAHFTLKPVAGGGDAGSRKPLKPASPEPSLNRQEPSKKTRTSALTVSDLEADGVSAEVAAEFLMIRKRKRAPLTPLAWSGIKAEAAKAGWTLERALRKVIARGWQGFEAAWVRDEKGEAPAGRRGSLLDPDDIYAGAR